MPCGVDRAVPGRHNRMIPMIIGNRDADMRAQDHGFRSAPCIPASGFAGVEGPGSHTAGGLDDGRK